MGKKKIRKKDESHQVNDWRDAESYVDLKRNLKAISFKKNISKGIRQLLAKLIVATLAPPSGKSIWNNDANKAIRKHGHGKANPYLKGVQKPLIKYAETGRLNPTEVLELRNALLQKGAPVVLSWGLGGFVILILLLIMIVFSWYSDFLKYLTDNIFFFVVISTPIIGEVIKLIYKKWGVEWFLKDCEIEDC